MRLSLWKARPSTSLRYAQDERGQSSRDYLKGLRSLAEDHPEAGRRVVVCLDPRARRTEDGIDILPASTFVARLWRGDLVAG